MTDIRDKEVIKNIQAKTQIINKLQDKASKVLVLELGSYTIKMGFANQKVPFTIRPFIAYKRSKRQSVQDNYQQEEVDSEAFKKQFNQIELYLKNEGIISFEHRPVKGKPRGKQSINLSSYPEFSGKDTLYSEQALAVQDCPQQYIFKKPIKHGQFNIKNQSNQQLQGCLNDLEKLVKYMLKEKLKIPEKQWKTFNCILILPDVFIRNHIKFFISTLFSKIGFSRLYVHLESLLACLGTAVSSACVVDIGHQKISICCVDEGVIVPKTLVRKNFGLKHISKTMIRLFNNRINQQGFDLSIDSEADQGQVDEIKQIACTIKQPQQNSNKLFIVKTFRQKKIAQIPINYSDVMCISANSIFFNIWNSFPFNEQFEQAFNTYSDLFDLQSDPEDFFQEYSGGGHFYQIQQQSVNELREVSNPYIYHPLQEIVLASIISIKDQQLRKKFLSNILIIGGGGLLPGLQDELISRLNKLLQTKLQSEEKAEAASDIIISKQSDISYCSWLGGTVLPKLDSLRDLWIQKNKYIGCMKEQNNDMDDEGILDKKLFTRKQQSQQWGIRYLKEKISFLW